MTALLALLAGCGLWIVGMRLSPKEHADRRSLEYWWGFTAFFIGGIGTLGSFSFVTLSSDQGTAIRLAPILLLGIIMTFHAALDRNAFIPPAGLALLFFFGILIAGEGGLMPLASFLAYLPAIIVPKRGYDLDSLRAGAISGVSLFLVTISTLALLMPGAIIGPCRSADKCSFLGVALGAMSAGNALGMYLAAASAIALLSSTKWPFLLTLAGGFLLTELTASRSGLASWYLIVALVAIYRISRHLRSRIPLIAAVFSVCILAAAIPLMNWRASELTYRPILWWHALSLFERSPLLGYGASYWARDENSFRTGRGFGLGLNYSTHNIVLELLVSAGTLGLLAFAIALLLAILNVHELRDSLYIIALVGIFVALSLTEVTSAPGRVYLFDGIGIYLLMAASAAGASTPLSRKNSGQPQGTSWSPSQDRAGGLSTATEAGSATAPRIRADR